MPEQSEQGKANAALREDARRCMDLLQALSKVSSALGDCMVDDGAINLTFTCIGDEFQAITEKFVASKAPPEYVDALRCLIQRTNDILELAKRMNANHKAAAMHLHAAAMALLHQE